MKENPRLDPDPTQEPNLNKTEILEPKVILKQRVKNSGNSGKKSENHGMERTILTNWSKKAKNSQKSKIPKEPEISANGAVRPKEAWNRNAPPKILITPPPDPLLQTTQIPEVESGNRVNMLKIGLGVFGGIALVLGCMLSFFYIQKKKKDEKLKNARKFRHRTPPAQHLPDPYHHDPYHGGQPYPYQSQAQFQEHPNMFQMPPGGPGGPVGPGGPAGPGFIDPNFVPGANVPNIPVQYENEFTGQIETHFITQQQLMEQQAMEQNYYNMCQEYILQQRQMQAQAHYEQQPGYNTVLQYVEQIGENLKTPKARKLRKDGNATPHPIITRRGSMKSLAQSEASGWNTEGVIEAEQGTSDKEEDVKSLATSVVGSNLDGTDGIVTDCDQSEHGKARSEKSRSDSAYGSRGSIQSPHSPAHNLKTLPKVNSAHMYSDEDHITDQSEAEDLNDSPLSNKDAAPKNMDNPPKKIKMTSFEDEVIAS
jgi:hypothetical protein